jgi:hypothetical protein
MDNLWGALGMGALLNFLSLRGYFGSFDDLVFGAILILIMMFFPRGLLRMNTIGRLARRAAKRASILLAKNSAARGSTGGGKNAQSDAECE